MELPRRRTGSYEPRSAVGNILAPMSGLQGSAELRTTPSTRNIGAWDAARPPWATELDTTDAPQPHAPQNQPPRSGPSSASSRYQRAGVQVDRNSDAFNVHTPAPAVLAVRASSQASARHLDASDGSKSSDNLSGPWPSSASALARPQSGGRVASRDQLDLWSQQQQPGHHASAQGRRNEGLYARVEHMETAAAVALQPAKPSRHGAVTVAAPPAAQRRGSVTGDGMQLRPGDLSDGNLASSAAARIGAASGRAGGAGHVGASPARAARTTDGQPPGRSLSTPKPRPAAPPKRPSSITDNARRDWVGVCMPASKAGGAAAGSAAAAAAGRDGDGRWGEDPDGDDRGSWLFAGDAEHQQNSTPQSRSRDLDLGSRPASDRRRLLRQPTSAGLGNAADGHGCDDGGGSGGRGDGHTSPGRQERHPPPPPAPMGQPRPKSPTLSPPATIPAVVLLAGSSSVAGLSLGHGPSAGIGSGGGAAAAARRRSGGPGASSASQAESSRQVQVQVLQEENARLQDQVQHLERLLAAATPHAAAEAAQGRKAPNAAVGRPSSAGCTAVAPSIAAASAGGIILQQYKSQVIQLQRQVALMAQEIEAKSRLGFEAEGALLGVASKLAELASSTSSGSSSRAAAAVGGCTEPALPGTAAEAAAAGQVPAEALRRDQLTQLHKWSKQMLARLRSEKSESSKLFTQQAYDSRGPRGGFLGLGHGAASWADRGGGGGAPAVAADGASFAPTWVVPFLPAGGNRFLLAGGAAAAADDLAGAAGGGSGGTSLAAIASGQAALLVDPLLTHRLELQLAAVAPKLAALSVLLKTQLLPAMPWLGLEAADRLQAEVGEAAESVAQSADALVQLCSLLPAGAAVFGEGPVAQEPKRRAAEVDAGRDSWLYSSPELLDAPEPPSPAVNDDGVISVPRLQAAIAPLLRDRKTGNKALLDILEPVRSRSQSAAAKRAVLETELRFASRASALHAEHVSHLMLSVGMALEECRGAKDAAAIKSYFNAAAAVRQVLEGADALEVHPCETCLKALVDVIRVHRDTLGRVPELLINAPAADVEGRLMSKVEELHQGFKKAISRLEAHKRRQRDVAVGGSSPGGGPERGQGARSDYDNDDFEAPDGEDSAGGGTTAREEGSDGLQSSGGGGKRGPAAAADSMPRWPPPTSSSAASPPHHHQQQASAAKLVKPPRPRPEWQG